MNCTRPEESDPLLANLDRDGFVILSGAFSVEQVERMLRGVAGIREQMSDEAAVLTRAGTVCAARNVLSLWPEAAELWRQEPLCGALARILGSEFGLVRILFFDKPPTRSWTLPWHRDMTIAVRDNTLPSDSFRRPTRKAGLPHVEAPRAVLEQMLTARIHLDNVTDENGPLRVQPGSHRADAPALASVVEQAIFATCGDVLLMRPLLVHASGHSLAGTIRHRRILHLEFAASPLLPDGLAWHDFHPWHRFASVPV